MTARDTSSDSFRPQGEPLLRTDVLIGAVILAFTAVPIALRWPSHGLVISAFQWRFEAVDFAANVLGYLPFGVALVRFRFIRSVLVAAGLAILAETIQVFCVGRSPSIADVTANILGAGIGWLLVRRRRLLTPFVAITERRAWFASFAAILYIVLGGRFTVEAVLEDARRSFVSPPWMAENTRGLRSDGQLEAHWTFDRLEDGVISDVSSNHANGVAKNGPTLIDGIHGAALELNGKQWVDFGAPLALRLTGSMTLSAWIYPRAFPWDDAAIISSLTDNELGYQLDVTPDQGERTIGFKLADASGRLMARYGRTALAVGHWYHVAGVYDATRRTLDVYLDGRPDNGCLVGTVTDHQRAVRQRVFVGRRAGMRSFEFIGAIDDAEIQSRALSQTEIEQAVASGGRAPDAGSSPSTQGSTHTETCTRPERPPRIAGPLVVLGMVIGAACLGLWPGRRVAAVALGLCALTGATAAYWLSDRAVLENAWLPLVFAVTGGAAILGARRRRG